VGGVTSLATLPSIAAIQALGDAEIAKFASEIDRDYVGPAILERVLRLVIAVTHFVEGVADPIMIAQTRFLARLITKSSRFLDLAPAVQATGRRSGGCGDACADENGREAGKNGGTHGQTVDVSTEVVGV
jgi:hypothetical protein